MPDQSCGGSPFHPGERALQQRLGVRDKMEAVGRRVLRDFMPDQHRAFFAALPFLVLTVDDAGWPAASIVAGAPGFASTPDATTLRVRARPPAAALDRHAGAGTSEMTTRCCEIRSSTGNS